MAGKACHVVAFATQIGLIPVLEHPMKISGALACMALAIVGCGKQSDRNVYGNASDEQPLSRCTTGSGMTMALYINSGGGAAVGTSFSVTAEHKPGLAERQILYSEIPAILSLKCTSDGFDLATSLGPRHFADLGTGAMRATPMNLDEQYKVKP
jgi:hypothetical protein